MEVSELAVTLDSPTALATGLTRVSDVIAGEAIETRVCLRRWCVGPRLARLAAFRVVNVGAGRAAMAGGGPKCEGRNCAS